MVHSFGTGQVEEERMVELVRELFPLTPKGMIDHLKLRQPIYRKTAAFGHFGRTEPSFTWEATDKAAALRDSSRVAVAAK
jgi:S-adenosylmethionine synthetase